MCKCNNFFYKNLKNLIDMQKKYCYKSIVFCSFVKLLQYILGLLQNILKIE